MPRRGPSEADLYLLYGFASALVFLMGIIIVMRSRGRRMYDVEARGVAARLGRPQAFVPDGHL